MNGIELATKLVASVCSSVLKNKIKLCLFNYIIKKTLTINELMFKTKMVTIIKRKEMLVKKGKNT